MIAKQSRTFELTAGKDVLVVKSAHFWSKSEIEQHFEDVEKALRTMRAQYRIGRMLVDLTNAGAQSKESTGHIYERVKNLHREGDRVAFIVSSALLAMQLRRVQGPARYEYFENEAAALGWLRSPD